MICDIDIGSSGDQLFRPTKIVVGQCFHEVARGMHCQNQLNNRVVTCGGSIVPSRSQLFVFMPWICSRSKKYRNDFFMTMNRCSIKSCILLKVFQVWVCPRDKELLYDGKLPVPSSIHKWRPVHGDDAPKEHVRQWLYRRLAPGIDIGSRLDALLHHSEQSLGCLIPEFQVSSPAEQSRQHGTILPTSGIDNSMSTKPIIAVIGATGAQGGGLVRAILSDPAGTFAVRAITRDVTSEKALALAALGAEVVAANLDDVASLEAAFAGAHGAFCVTNFWEHFSTETELAQAKNLADAAKSAGVAHVIWSTLEDTRKWVPLEDDRMPTLQGKYKVPHFDAKGEANAFFTERGVPTTFLLTSFYWDNFIGFGMGPQRGPDGKLAITLPMGDKPLPGIAGEDIGKCAYGVFKAGSTWLGKTVGISGEHITGAEMAAQMSGVFGEEISYNAVPAAVYRTFGFPGADDLGNMFQFKHDFNDDFCGARSIETSKTLNPELQDFAAWLAKNGERIPRN